MRRTMRVAGGVLFAALAATPLAAVPGATSPSRAVRAADFGAIVDAPDGVSQMEMVRFDSGLSETLVDLPVGGAVRIDDWPVAPAVRRSVVLTRFDVYAPDAKIVAIVEGGREVEVPRAKTLFFRGIAYEQGRELGRLLVTLEPDSKRFGGFAMTIDGMHELTPEGAAADRYAVARRGAMRAAGSEPLQWSCVDDLPAIRPGAKSEPALHASAPAAPLAVTRSAVIAVDTDNELLNLKFGNNTASATAYIAAVIAGMTVIYERDVGSGQGNGVRLFQGYTILRPSTTADEYTGGTGSADSAKLSEFASFWEARYPRTVVRRALAMMLSGKQSSNFSASGIAYRSLNILCGSSGYSFSQVFKFGGATAADDMLVLAHEVGHNFGSPHTHCYTVNKPDTCFNGEACYGGATACPASATYNGVTTRGTLMSYCHLLGGCDQDALVFHPETMAQYFLPALAQGSASCVASVGGGGPPAAPTISNVNPGTGALGGGTSITITGTNFVSGATVSFIELPSNDVFGGSPNSKSLTGVSFTNSTTLTATTPSAANTGIVDLIVQNPDGQTATLRNAFTYGLPTPTATTFYTLAPCRLVDTRNPNGPLGGPALTASQTRLFTLTGTCGVPATAKSLSLNVTVVTPAAGGYLTLFPGGGSQPATSTINYLAGQVRANNAIVLLATSGNGTLNVFNGSGGATHVILDVNGYFQ